MRKLFAFCSLCVFAATALFAQQTQIGGTVSDPTGAVIPAASVTIANIDNGSQRTATSDAQGRYTILQVTPGPYRLTAKAPGFTDVVISEVRLLVNQPATVDITFEKVGSTKETISIEAAGTQINTVDASLGNVITATAITELPLPARNIAGLLALQPGVASFGVTDDRSGSVNGGRSDQANITLDGADVNFQGTREALRSVLRVTPDSVEEFRTTTTNAGADQGRGSGANIALITKSGTNDLHGSLYEFRRGNETAANTFFNNKASLPKAPLLINVFGASAGGPIRRNKLFIFGNYEGRRDASATNVTRTVPMEHMKQGIVKYHTAGNVLTEIGPADIRAKVDPLGIGINQAALDVLKQYPAGNNPAVGDGLNTIGYLFIAPQHTKQDTYTSKLDYKINDRHSLFWRGTLQNDHADGTPQFPGAQPNSVTLSNNKGMASGWTAVLRPNLVSTTNYSFTRQGLETTGILAGSYVYFRGITPIYGTSTGFTRIVPVHSVTEDLAWSRGRHDFRFGGIGRFISNQVVDFARAYNNAVTNVSYLNGSGADITPASLGIVSGDRTSYQYAMVAVLGIITQATGNYNYKTDGSVIPAGAPVSRNFVSREGEFYAQDSWRIKSNLTFTYGLRVSVMPPVHEANGQQITTNIPLGDWMDMRGVQGELGRSNQSAGLVSYLVAGRPYYPHHNNFAPRLAMAYSPKGQSRLSKFFFGEGMTSIRIGAGQYYDLIGQPLANFISNNSFGLSNSLTTPPNVYDSTQFPRFTGFYKLPPSPPTAPQFLLPAPPAGFPATYPNAFSITSSLDDKLKAPYSMNLNFSIGREFGKGWYVEGSYVGRLSRHNLVQRDLAMPTNLKDPASGQTYFQAMTQLGTLLDLQGVKVANLPKIPFFENLWATAAGNGYTATQAVAKDYLERSNPGDFTNVLSDMDGAGCRPASTYNAAGNITRLACGTLGSFSMWSPQYSALNAWTSLGSGAYHSMQWTVRKRMSTGLTFDFNYTLSKSLDIGSRSENSSQFSTDFMINSWNAQQLRGPSRYDARHQVNGYVVWMMPFGRGRRFGGHMNRVLDAFIGGWEISATGRVTSGLPFSVSDGSRWATNWQLSSFATPNGLPIPTSSNSHNAKAVSGPGGPNLWDDPKAALDAFQETMAGQTGSRNTLRGEGYFNIDTGLYKQFSMPYNEKHKIQFRWESFNLTNSVRFDPLSASVSLTNTARFGQFTDTLNTPRQMQFALRYKF